MKEIRVLAVVVTFNRRELLTRCLDHLHRQTRRVDHVLVVNNGSTDGTEEMLAQRGVACITQENVGSAGGWHTGIEAALAQGFDAVWLMDDDGFPDSRALARLVPHIRNPAVACASSVVVQEGKPERFVFGFPMLDKAGIPVLFARRRKVATLAELRDLAPSGTYPFTHLFNGALVSADAAKVVGNVDRSFFIFGDEVDYFFRLRKAGQVVSVLDALHYHPDVSARPYSPAKVYYYLRNTLVLNQRYYPQRWFRHVAAAVAVLGRTASRNGVIATLSLVAGPKSAAFYTAIARGLRGQIGKDFDG